MLHTYRGAAAVVVSLVVGLALAVPVQASARDADRDGMPNRWERAHGLNWQKANARGDVDRDGITNIEEFRLGLDPRHPDQQCTDLEIALGATDPSQCGSTSLTMVLH